MGPPQYGIKEYSYYNSHVCEIQVIFVKECEKITGFFMGVFGKYDKIIVRIALCPFGPAQRRCLPQWHQLSVGFRPLLPEHRLT